MFISSESSVSSQRRLLFFRHLVFISLLCLFLSTSVGCGVPANSVIVDNTTNAVMIVEVNGQRAVEVLPGKFEWVACMPGKYEFRVTSNKREVYKGQHILEPTDHPLRPRVYVLNPADNCGYTVATVEYGSSNIVTEGVMEGLVALGEEAHEQKLSPNTRAFIALKRKTRPIPTSSWFEAKGAYYLLQQPPKSVATRVGRIEYYPVLTRISKNDQEEINKAHRVRTPDIKDVMSLQLSTRRAFQSLSELAPPPGPKVISTTDSSNHATDSI